MAQRRLEAQMQEKQRLYNRWKKLKSRNKQEEITEPVYE